MAERLRVRADALEWRTVEGEIVALDLRRSLYLAINPSGAAIWPALVEGASRDELVERLCAECEVNRQTAESDVDGFLSELASQICRTRRSDQQSGSGRLVRNRGIRRIRGEVPGKNQVGSTEVEMSSSSMSRRDGGVYRRAGLTVALALAALAAVPAIASAAAVSTSGTVITYTAASSETNVLTVTNPSANTFVFDEASISITESSANCTAASGNVTCSGVTWTSVVVNLLDNDDTFTAAAVTGTAVPFTINGGDDDDGNIIGSSANDIINGEGTSDNSTATGLNGGPGNDTINGGPGSAGDIINGGTGNDRLIGEEGNDTINGDAGIDRVLYSVGCSESPPSISITIDGTANDSGCNSETTENVGTTVESVTGSTGNDTITGSCFANTIAGDPGSANGDAGGVDTINGDPSGGCLTSSFPSGSTDFMGGGEGADVFDGDGTIDGTHAAGFDTVTYGFPYTGAVAATCSGQAVTTGFAVNLDTDNSGDDCDGFGNTTENVHSDIERIIGSGAADRVNAGGAGQGVQLFGRLGNDTLIGSPNGDFLDGEGGTDTLDCAGGTDTYRTDGGESISNCETQI
jgi:Ca2+-binding RTX toxin-like protein